MVAPTSISHAVGKKQSLGKGIPVGNPTELGAIHHKVL